MTYSSIPAMAALAIAVTLPAAAFASEPKETVIVIGAINDPNNAQYAQAPVDKNVPALPVVYDKK